MARKTKAAQAAEKTIVADPLFIGTDYSNQEIAFLLEHLGKPSAVVFQELDDELPDGVNEDQITPILNRTFELEQVQNATRDRLNDEGLTLWCGYDKLREVLVETQQWRAKRLELKRRTRNSDGAMRRAAGAPSLCMWDPTTGVPYYGGAGADAGKVTTAIGPGYQRIPLTASLQETEVGAIHSFAGIADFVSSGRAASDAALNPDTPENIYVQDHGQSSTLQCPVCGHAEEFETAKPSEKQKAMTRMMKHLRTARTKPEVHRVLKLRIESGMTGRRPIPVPDDEATV